LVYSTLGNSATSYLVTPSQTVTIDEHGLCKKVTNNSVLTIFVPTKTSAEWLSFRTNLPSNIALSDCFVGCLAGTFPASLHGYTGSVTVTNNAPIGGTSPAVCNPDLQGTGTAYCRSEGWSTSPFYFSDISDICFPITW